MYTNNYVCTIIIIFIVIVTSSPVHMCTHDYNFLHKPLPHLVLTKHNSCPYIFNHYS